MKAFHWCDFAFDDKMFPDPKGQIARLKSSGKSRGPICLQPLTSLGLVKKVCVWVNPYLGQASPLFKFAASQGYLLRRKNGDIFQYVLT